MSQDKINWFMVAILARARRSMGILCGDPRVSKRSYSMTRALAGNVYKGHKKRSKAIRRLMRSWASDIKAARPPLPTFPEPFVTAVGKLSVPQLVEDRTRW